eukprot:13074812-Ditylum_brightwellii.AAC.1
MYDSLLAGVCFKDAVTSDKLKVGKQAAGIDLLVTVLSYSAMLQRQINYRQQAAAHICSELAGKKQCRYILELDAEERRLKIEKDTELTQR